MVSSTFTLIPSATRRCTEFHPDLRKAQKIDTLLGGRRSSHNWVAFCWSPKQTIWEYLSQAEDSEPFLSNTAPLKNSTCHVTCHVTCHAVCLLCYVCMHSKCPCTFHQNFLQNLFLNWVAPHPLATTGNLQKPHGKTSSQNNQKNTWSSWLRQAFKAGHCKSPISGPWKWDPTVETGHHLKLSLNITNLWHQWTAYGSLERIGFIPEYSWQSSLYGSFWDIFCRKNLTQLHL